MSDDMDDIDSGQDSALFEFVGPNSDQSTSGVDVQNHSEHINPDLMEEGATCSSPNTLKETELDMEDVDPVSSCGDLEDQAAVSSKLMNDDDDDEDLTVLEGQSIFCETARMSDDMDDIDSGQDSALFEFVGPNSDQSTSGVDVQNHSEHINPDLMEEGATCSSPNTLKETELDMEDVDPVSSCGDLEDQAAASSKLMNDDDDDEDLTVLEGDGATDSKTSPSNCDTTDNHTAIDGSKTKKRKKQKAVDKELDIDTALAELDSLTLTKYTSYEDCICTICAQSLSDPRLLDCLHTFCLLCIRKIMELKSEPWHIFGHTIQVYKVICPVCKDITKVPVNKENMLTKNSVLLNSTAMKKCTSNGHCEVCKLLNVQTDAVSFCFECKDMLCQECWDKHKFTRFTLNHNVKTLEEVSNEVVNKEMMQRQVETCHRHQDQDMKYYCKDCSLVTCRDCILLEHHNHSCLLLSEIVAQRKKELELLVLGVKHRIKDLDENDVQKFDEKFENLETKERREVEKVQQITGCLIDSIREEEQRILKELEQKFLSIKNHYRRRKISASKSLYHLRDALKMLEMFVSESKGEEYLEMEPIFRHRLFQMLNQEVSPKPAEQCPLPATDANALLLDSNFALKYPLFQISQSADGQDQVEDYPSLLDLARDTKKWKELGFTEERAKYILEGGLPVFKTKVDSNKPSNVQDKSAAPKSDVSETVNRGDGMIEDGSSDVLSSVDSQHGAKPKTAAKRKRRARKKKSKEATDSNPEASQSDESVLYNRENTSKTGKINKAGKVDENIQNQTFPKQGYVPQMYGNGMQSHHALMHPGMDTWNLLNAQPYPSFTGHQLFGAARVPRRPSYDYSADRNSPVPAASGNCGPLKPEKGKKIVNPSETVPPKQVVTITPKWRLDTRIQSDEQCPYITSIHSVQSNRIVASDSKNNKIKIFDIKGNFLHAFDAINPTSVAYVSACFMWTSDNTVFLHSPDEGFGSKMVFQRSSQPLHPLSWMTKGRCIVGNGDHVRFYHIDKEKKTFVRKAEVFFRFSNQQSIGQIYGVGSDTHGKELVLTDLDKKTVVIATVDGDVKGVYTEHSQQSTWLPGGACFDKKGNVFALDYSGNRLLLLNKEAKLLQQWNTNPTIENPWSVACSGTEHLCVTGNDHYIHIYQYKYN